MNVTLFTVPLVVAVAVIVFRHRLPHVARSLHHAQRDYRQGTTQATSTPPPASSDDHAA